MISAQLRSPVLCGYLSRRSCNEMNSSKAKYILMYGNIHKNDCTVGILLDRVGVYKYYAATRKKFHYWLRWVCNNDCLPKATTKKSIEVFSSYSCLLWFQQKNKMSYLCFFVLKYNIRIIHNNTLKVSLYHHKDKCKTILCKNLLCHMIFLK